MLCDGNHPGREAKAGPYDLSQCRLCWLGINQGSAGKESTRVREGAFSPVTFRDGRCIHLGVVTDKLVNCPACTGNVKLKLFGCGVHEKCTLEKTAPKVACCKTCPDYKTAGTNLSSTSSREKISNTPKFALQTPTVRNLLYHIYPLRGSVWRWNVVELCKRIKLFNGRRVVAVVTDHHTDDSNEVEKLFGGEVDEFIRLRNAPELREVLTFDSLFSRVQSKHPSHVTFYGHAKGVGRGAKAVGWTRLLYETNLDYYPAVEELLNTYPVMGSCKKVGRGWPSNESLSEWHYSGSFFWFRNRDLFTKPNWQKIDSFWGGIEPYPSLHFKESEAGCLFWQGLVPEVNMYNPSYLKHVLNNWKVWKAGNVSKETML